MNQVIKVLRNASPLVLIPMVCVLVGACAVIDRGAQDGAIISANEHFEKGNYGKALEALDRADSYIEPPPAKAAEICYKRGYILLLLGRFEEAKINFRQAKKYEGTIYAGYAVNALDEVEKAQRKAKR